MTNLYKSDYPTYIRRAQLKGKILGISGLSLVSLWANTTYNDKVNAQIERRIPGAKITDTAINGYRIYTPDMFEHGETHAIDVKLEDGSTCQVTAQGERFAAGFIPAGAFGVKADNLDFSDCESPS